MAKVRVLYWKEIPVQIQTQSGSDRVSELLHPRFQEAVDAVAMFEGTIGTDNYLEGWMWVEQGEVAGNPQEVAESLVYRFNQELPTDLTALICKLHRSGQRNTHPGSLEKLLSEKISTEKS